jgi:hypothetical protein
MPNPAILTRAYKALSWAAVAGLALILVLVLRKSPPPDVPYDPTATTRVQQKFAAADQAKATGQPAQVQLDSTELNSYLSQNLQTQNSTQPAGATDSGSTPPGGAASSSSASSAQSGEPAAGLGDGATLEQVQSAVKDVKVDMDGDLVKAYVVFDFHGKDLSLELDGHVGAQDGLLKFEPVAGKLGSMPLPQSMLDSAVQKMMASPENREKLRLPSDISDIQIVNGQAVVSYK